MGFSQDSEITKGSETAAPLHFVPQDKWKKQWNSAETTIFEKKLAFFHKKRDWRKIQTYDTIKRQNMALLGVALEMALDFFAAISTRYSVILWKTEARFTNFLHRCLLNTVFPLWSLVILEFMEISIYFELSSIRVLIVKTCKANLT